MRIMILLAALLPMLSFAQKTARLALPNELKRGEDPSLPLTLILDSNLRAVGILKGEL